MIAKLTCPNCRENVAVPSLAIGSVRCAKCGTVIEIMEAAPSESNSPKRRICEICKKEVAETDGKERDHYSSMVVLTGVPGIPKKVFVCSACGGMVTPAFKVFLYVMGVVLAIMAGCGIWGAMIAPRKKS